MGSANTRKRGSKQFWPRVRALKPYAVVGSWTSKNVSKDANFLGFPGYKVGMTNISLIDNFSHTLTKGTEINLGATVIECPPIRVMSIRLFGLDDYGNLQVKKEISAQVKDKNLSRKIDVSKKTAKTESKEDILKFANENQVESIRVKVATEPAKTTGTGKKKPEILELGISGTLEEQLTFALDKLGKEVKLSDVFHGGELTDSHSITTGKGWQGAVKRFGVKLTAHKSEKKRRHAGNVGAWHPSRVHPHRPLPGQIGYHERTEWNKWILKVSDKADEINPVEGFKHYGKVRNEYLIVKGSVAGPCKRMITLVKTIRPNPRYPKVAPQIVSINK